MGFNMVIKRASMKAKRKRNLILVVAFFFNNLFKFCSHVFYNNTIIYIVKSQLMTGGWMGFIDHFVDVSNMVYFSLHR